ncbi:unnamed protein product [Chironomus riparius]|uniref:Transmembrane protein n=1 Tax=Chironomus riparius TaxID=315576 RepID=A0A9N9RQ13_9DIPT|nr:unnamed protein product [Chironomus riparius]
MKIFVIILRILTSSVTASIITPNVYFSFFGVQELSSTKIKYQLNILENSYFLQCFDDKYTIFLHDIYTVDSKNGMNIAFFDKETGKSSNEFILGDVSDNFTSKLQVYEFSFSTRIIKDINIFKNPVNLYGLITMLNFTLLNNQNDSDNSNLNIIKYSRIFAKFDICVGTRSKDECDNGTVKFGNNNFLIVILIFCTVIGLLIIFEIKKAVEKLFE